MHIVFFNRDIESKLLFKQGNASHENVIYRHIEIGALFHPSLQKLKEKNVESRSRSETVSCIYYSFSTGIQNLIII